MKSYTTIIFNIKGTSGSHRKGMTPDCNQRLWQVFRFTQMNTKATIYNFYPCVDTYWYPCTDTNNNKIQIHMSNKSKQGNIIGSGPQRDGAFGGRKTIMRKDPWFPGKSRGCNHGANNPGRKVR